MQRSEFEYLIGKEVTDKEYDVINKVYLYHPAIKKRGGKVQLADIYKNCGMSVIKNMEETADYMIKLKGEINKYNRKINKINSRIQKLKDGNIEYERCARDLQLLFHVSDTREIYEWGKKQLSRWYGTEMVKELEKELNNK